jgi:hypothetical protein
MQTNQATWRMLGGKLRDLMPVSAEATTSCRFWCCVLRSRKPNAFTALGKGVLQADKASSMSPT